MTGPGLSAAPPGAPPGPGPAVVRLVALADGVFAIVMTLMVFNLTLPKGAEGGDLGRALLALWPQFLAFGISFGLVGIYWSAHQTMFAWFVRGGHELNWLNLLFLAFVSLVPFTTSLLAAHHHEPIALGLYGANLALIGLALLPIWLYANGRGRLVPAALPASVVRYGVSRCLVGAVGYGLAAALALISPPAALVLFASIPLLYILPPIQRAWLRVYGLGPGLVPSRAPGSPTP